MLKWDKTIGRRKSSGQAAYDYLKNMLDSIADPIFVKDKNHCWVDGNRAFWELMGGPPEKFLGKTDYEFFPKAEADVFWEKDNKVFTTGETIINEEFLTDYKGIRHIISTKKALFLNEKGGQVLVGIIRDITAQKELEELKAHTSETALSQKEQQYRSIFTSTNDAILIFGMDGHLVEANPGASKIYGYTHEEFIGMDGKDFSPSIDKTKFSQFIKNAQSGKQYFVESTHVRKDGTLLPVEINGTAFRYAGEPHLLAVIRDITERKQAQDALKEADRRKDEFLAMLAHELRNPLAPISNAIHIMKSPSVSDTIRQEAASLVERQVNQMTQLLNDLLDVSRVTLGKIELRRQMVTLSEVINRAIEIAKPLIDERGHSLNVNIPQNPIWLDADITRLSQVFSNLLNNSAKYTENAGRIDIYAFEEKSGLTVKITDNGIGIAKEMLPHVFDLFVQADSSMERAQGGLGIGLTLVKNIVEMHKGSITAYSDGKGKGSEFTVRLPVKVQAAKEEKHKAILRANSGISYRMLVVDDNIASAKTLGWMLEMLGHKVQLAHEGLAAIEMAKTFLPHVILLDIGLPKMSGYEVCQALRRENALKNIVIIAQTGWGQKEHLQQSKEAGFDYHLVKPINLETLQQILEECTSGKAKALQSNSLS